MKEVANGITEELLCALYRVYHYTPEVKFKDRNFANLSDQDLRIPPYFNELAKFQEPIKYILRRGIAEALNSNDYNDTQQAALKKLEKKFETLKVVFEQRAIRSKNSEPVQQDLLKLELLLDPTQACNKDDEWRGVFNNRLKHFITQVCLSLNMSVAREKMQELRTRFDEISKQADKEDQGYSLFEKWVKTPLQSYDNMGLDFWLHYLQKSFERLNQANGKLFKQFIWEASKAIPRRYSRLDDGVTKERLARVMITKRDPLMRNGDDQCEEILENDIKSETKEVSENMTATLSSSAGERNTMKTCTNLHGFQSNMSPELDSLADILKTKTQSFDSRVACHWVALARLKVNADEQTRLIVANKGALEYDEEKNKPKTLHDAGKTYTIKVESDVMGGAPHYSVQLFSSSYSGKDNVPEIFNEEIKDEEIHWVLTVNHKVATRMRAKDIENFLNAPTSGIQNNSKSIAEGIRSVAYQRVHMDFPKSPIDPQSIDISVVVLPITRKVNEVVFATIESVQLLFEDDELNQVSKFNHEDEILSYAAGRHNLALDAFELISVDVLSDVDGVVLKEVDYSKKDLQEIKGYDHDKELIDNTLESLKKLIERAQKKNLDVLHPELERFYNLVEKDIYSNKDLESLLDEIQISATLVMDLLNDKKKTDSIEQAANIRVAISHIQKIENKTSIYDQAERVAKVILGVLAGLVVGAMLATLLIATGTMPTAIVGALTVTGWVLTMALPLGLGAGSLIGYGIFGRRAERERRSGEKIHDELLTILEPIRVESMNAV